MPVDFAAAYSRMADEELLALAVESDELTDEAHGALWTELRRRGLESHATKAYEERAAEQARQRPPLSLPRLVTIATFTDPLKAHLARTRLEADEIECVVADEGNARMIDWAFSALGYIKLRVKESDAERAIRLLETLEDEVGENES